MTDVMTTAQVVAFFWDMLKGVGSLLIIALAYFIREWRSTQKEQAIKVEQLVSDMRSLRDATQANSKAISDMIISHGKALTRMEEGAKETNRQLVESFKLIAENEMLKIKNTS